MKKCFLILSAVIAAVLFSSCKEQEPIVPVLSLQNEQGIALTTLDVTAEGGDATLVVVTNTTFSATCEADWITITPAGADVEEGVETKVTVNVTVEANELEESRSATINIKAGDLKGSVTVNQAAVEKTVNYTMGMAEFDGEYGEWYVSLYSDEYIDSDFMSGPVATFIILVDEEATFADGLPIGSISTSSESDASLDSAGVIEYEDEEMVGMFFYSECTLTVSLDGETYTLKARGTDEEGNELEIDYTGTLMLMESEEGGEEMDYGDPVEINFAMASGSFDGVYEDGAHWSLALFDETMETMGMISLLCAPSATFDKGLPTGEFAINSTEEVILNTATTVTYINMSTFAMGGIPEGTVTITKNADETYTVVAEGPVGDGTSKYTYTGAIDVTDGTLVEDEEW